MAIMVDGKEVTRLEAYQLVFDRWADNICEGYTAELWYRLHDGWRPLFRWKDEELERYLATMDEWREWWKEGSEPSLHPR